MYDFNGFRADLAGKLAATGLHVTLDPRNVTPPMVVVGLPEITGRLTACSVAVTVDVTPVAPPPGNQDAIGWLLDALATILDATAWESASPSSFSLSPTQDLPAYTVAVSATVTEE